MNAAAAGRWVGRVATIVLGQLLLQWALGLHLDVMHLVALSVGVVFVAGTSK